MATIPNRYYNSPWIADAGRNLAAALAPPDPERTLAAQRAKWEFERAQQNAIYQDEQREAQELGRAAGGRLLIGDYNKPQDMGTGAGEMGFGQWMGAGQPEAPTVRDDAAFRADIDAATKGLPLGDVFTLLGPDNPKTKAQIAILEKKLANQNLRDDEKRDLQIQLAHIRGDDAMARTLAGIGSREGMQERGFGHDFEMQDRDFENDLVRINARGEAAAKAKGGKTYPIYGPVYKDIRLAVRGLEKQYGVTLDPSDRREIEGRIGEEYQSNPSVPDASNAVFKKLFPSGAATRSVEVPGKYYGTNTEQRLAPNYGGAPAAAASPAAGIPGVDGSLGGTFSLKRPANMPPASAMPAQSPVTSAVGDDERPPADMFTPGEAIEMDDGSVWALVGGVPTRIDNGG